MRLGRVTLLIFVRSMINIRLYLYFLILSILFFKYMYKQIDKSLRELLANNLILFPIDTDWGIGCDATNPDAVRKVYKLKQRNTIKY